MNKVVVSPFITAFATSIAPSNRQILRYDERRQLSQVLVNDIWIDASTVPEQACSNTRLTKVAQETTDDA